MDMEFYLNCPDMLDTIITNICDFTQETLGEKIKFFNDPSNKEDDSLYMGCSLYQVDVTSVERCPASLWISEDYHVDVTVMVWLEIFSSSYDSGLEHITRLFFTLLRLYPGDAIFFDMGSGIVYRKNAAGLYMDDGEELWDGLLERERQRKKDSVKLQFRFQTLAFPTGEDCLSIDFEQGYELLTTFLVFETSNAYPAIYKALMAVLNQRSERRVIGLNACSLEIHPDTTKIMDDLAGDGKGRFCEIATEELLFFIQIWADELDMRLRLISKEEMEAELDEMLKEEHRKFLEEKKKEEQEVEKFCEPEILESKKDEESKWKFFWKKPWKAKDEKEPQESEEQKKERQESVVACRNLGGHTTDNQIDGIPRRPDGNYPSCFPEEMSRQEIADIIHEAYDNKVCIIENAYMGRAENGMKIALFLSDAGKILSAFPLC